MLINGTLENPADDASKIILEKVHNLKCQFTAVDMIENKAFMEYFGDKQQDVPYVFLKGVPACGLDGVDQLPVDDQFKAAFTERKMTVTEKIESLIKNNKVILFMKGVPDSPQCGFSSKIISILNQYDGLKFEHFNIFEDQELREALKKYSNWPTYPQLYVDGKLVGGIDIV